VELKLASMEGVAESFDELAAEDAAESIERAGGRAEMPLGQMQVDGRYFKISMTEQNLDGAQVGAGFKKVCGETMS
jgi:hypothetical protein